MYLISKRIFDVLSSVIALIIFSPFFIFIAIWIVLDSKGGFLYSQIRVGENEKQFRLLKFRSMKIGSDKSGELTIGNDLRVTSVGRLIRKTKFDEFPQLINVIKGDMSIVGPRPEVPRYTVLYNNEQKKVLKVKPGLTDYASIEYLDEQKILGESENPDEAYIQEVMPSKLKLNLKYIEDRSFWLDISLIFKTIFKIFG